MRYMIPSAVAFAFAMPAAAQTMTQPNHANGQHMAAPQSDHTGHGGHSDHSTQRAQAGAGHKGCCGDADADGRMDCCEAAQAGQRSCCAKHAEARGQSK